MSIRWFVTLLFLGSTITLIGGHIHQFFIQPSLAKTSPATIIQPLTQIYIGGGVKKPGLYRLSKGALLYHAVQRAGGLTDRALITPKFLAQRLPKSGHILIPQKVTQALLAPVTKKEAVKKSSKKAPKTLEKKSVSLNKATAKKLQKVKGIGPQLAKRIIKARKKQKFKTLNDLLKVPGIGPKTLKKLSPYFYL